MENFLDMRLQLKMGSLSLYVCVCARARVCACMRTLPFCVTSFYVVFLCLFDRWFFFSPFLLEICCIFLAEDKIAREISVNQLTL